MNRMEGMCLSWTITMKRVPNEKRRRRRLAPPPPPQPRVAGIRSGQFDEENPFVQNLSVLLVQADKGVSVLVVDRIGDIYHSLPRRADVIVTTVGARHKCQQGNPGFTAGRGFSPARGAPGGGVGIESLGLVFVVTVTQKYKDARASGNTALSSPCWDLLATMRRVVNYHSSWARQQQVELFDASGIRV
ncbi:putative protein phosphatase 2C 73 [Dorcoceras hygrometricum]|uniref:Uncharacterized protein n=1 Tax=Dorcoceras hygrometricum TaxID=472368 RepID=A0A2Z7CL27_9LAMI|nr:putative protein phosphatase 2C 73 [Dorcoceras hygrometricum]